MNYKRVYYELVESARNREVIDGMYYERHHILPRSMGGTDDESNLVTFTAREHFIAHALLAKFVKEEPYASRMKFAFFAMCNQRRDYQHRYIAKSKFYEMAKKAFSEAKKSQPTRHISDDHISALREGHKRYFSIQENRDAASESSKAFWNNPEYRQKMLDINREMRTEEYKQSISEGLRRHYDSESGDKHKKITSKLSKTRWEDDEYRQNFSAKIKAHWEDMTPEEYEEACKRKSEAFSAESRKRISETSKANAAETHKKVECKHCKSKISRQNHAKFHGDKCSKLTGIKHKQAVVYCRYCNKRCSPSTLARWHNDNCKLKDESS